MKRWQIYANKNIKLIKVDCSENAKRARIINEMWEKFAKTGKCHDVSCDFCPFGKTNLCGYEELGVKETYKERKRILNEEASAMSVKEVTEWNGEPREMLVWNDDENKKEKRFVIFIEPSSNVFPYIRVITWDALTGNMVMFKHCAEIEEQLMTHKELARWIREKPNREYKYGDYENVNVYSVFVYGLRMECEPVDKNIYVREGYGEWEKPLKSLLYKNWNYGKEFKED